MNNFAAFGKNIGAQFTPFAQRTQQYVKEQLGQAEEKTELPADYTALERRIDALKLVHTKLLSVTTQYTIESYDYPANYRETVNDLSRTVSEKVKLLSSASSTAEAQAALTSTPSTKPAPKTFNHALARASLASSQALTTGPTTASDTSLSTAFEKYALAQEKVGEARLYQDTSVNSRFLSPWQTTLNSSLSYAAKARRDVENARLSLDHAKARARARAGGSEPAYDDKTRVEIERVEDDFVAKVEEASGIMRNALDTPEPLRNLLELVRAQREFYDTAAGILGTVEGEVDALAQEAEESYRRSRNGA